MNEGLTTISISAEIIVVGGPVKLNQKNLLKVPVQGNSHYRFFSPCAECFKRISLINI